MIWKFEMVDDNKKSFNNKTFTEVWKKTETDHLTLIETNYKLKKELTGW